MATNTLDMNDVVGMVEHWLATPTDAYLGSGYGNDARSLLQQPQNTILADAFLQKLITDVPVLKSFPSGTINVYSEPVDKQHTRLIIDLAGTQVRTSTLGVTS